MKNQISTPFYFSFILVLIVAVQWTQVEGECTNIVGPCERCSFVCDAFAAGSKVLGHDCSFNNLCTCTFEEPAKGEPKCDIGLGLCTSDCGNDCCNKKCTSKYPSTGSGSCVNKYGVNYCSCTYKR
ncbi:putative defensin-like protein 180 [Vicia villosa]|uniref:putative defensin-like protein 180 n=1 Tax=Vicia villosa TaxID=3911 RepID=UPI00273C10C7|nr:putative defensin-like protein 180 [Vicia villosa]XP_058753445.1 putative defensin-like protein 180 [Vicia villosa]